MSDRVPGPRIGSLCTGNGGLDLAVELVLGGPLAWYAETDRHARTVLAHHWRHVPNLGDIRTIDWTHVPPVDVLPLQRLNLACLSKVEAAAAGRVGAAVDARRCGFSRF